MMQRVYWIHKSMAFKHLAVEDIEALANQFWTEDALW